MQSQLKHVVSWLARRVDELLGLLTLVTLVVVATGIFTRIFLLSAPWTLELAQWTFLAICLIGGALAIYRGEHLVFNLLRDYLPGTLRAMGELLILAGFALISVILIVGGIPVTEIAFRQHAYSLPASYGVIFSLVPISGALALVFLIPLVLHEIATLDAALHHRPLPPRFYDESLDHSGTLESLEDLERGSHDSEIPGSPS